MNRPVSSIMSSHVIAVDIDATIATVEESFARHRISCLPVLRDNGQCFGVITLSDLARFHLHDPALDAQRAWEVCTHKLIEALPHTPIRDVAALMVENQIHHVLITEDKRLVGLVSSLDLVAEYLLEPGSAG